MKKILIIALLTGILLITEKEWSYCAELGAGSGSGYPSAVDTDNTVESNATIARSDVPNDSNAAIIAIQEELGVDPAGSESTVKARLDALDAVDANTHVKNANSTITGSTIFSGDVTINSGLDLSQSTITAQGDAIRIGEDLDLQSNDLTDVNNISAVGATFTDFPEKSGGLTPSDDADFSTKKYVDDVVIGGGGGSLAVLASTQSFTGQNTFEKAIHVYSTSTFDSDVLMSSNLDVIGLFNTEELNIDSDSNVSQTFIRAQDSDSNNQFTVSSDASGDALIDIYDTSGGTDIRLFAANDSYFNTGGGLTIGGTSLTVGYLLDIIGAIKGTRTRVGTGSLAGASYSFVADTDSGIANLNSDNAIQIITGAEEVVQISDNTLQVQSDDSFAVYIGSCSRPASSDGVQFKALKSRGDSKAENSDVLLSIDGRGYDGSSYVGGAKIDLLVNGATGVGDMGGRMIFSVASDGGTTRNQIVRIDESGLKLENILAVDSNGLNLTDDGGNGIFVEDGGDVGIADTPSDYLANNKFVINIPNDGMRLTTSAGANASIVFSSSGVQGVANDNTFFMNYQNSSLPTNNQMKFWFANEHAQPVMTIEKFDTTAGRVGIRTQVPNAPLDVEGGIEATSFTYDATQSRKHSIAPTEITTGDEDDTFTMTQTYFRPSAGLATATGYAGIELPDGAIVTDFKVYWFRNDASASGAAELHVTTSVQGDTTMATANSDATSGYHTVTDSSITSATIDNDNMYSIKIAATPNDAVNDVEFIGAVITYTVTVPLP